MSPLMKLCLLIVVSCPLVGGCDVLGLFAKTPEVYVPSDSAVELYQPYKIYVWYSGKDGKRKKGYVKAYDRWLVGPPQPAIVMESKPVAEVMQ
jgi:hypothetical protein